jgi:DNA-binding response OmpR family regulator
LQTSSQKTIAILTGNSALSAIMEMVLAAHAHLNVRVFDDVDALEAFMGATRVEMVVAAFGPGPEGAVAAISGLRARAQNFVLPEFECIALANLSDGNLKAISIHAGINEVIAKPASPRYLEERVLARLGRPSARRLATHAGPERRLSRAPRGDANEWPSNVVPLFGPRPETPNHP